MTKPTNEMFSDALIRKMLGGLLVTDRSAADDIAVGDIFERQITWKVVRRDWPLWNDVAQKYGEFRVPLLGRFIAERTKCKYVRAIECFACLWCARVLTNQENARSRVASAHVTGLWHVFHGVAKQAAIRGCGALGTRDYPREFRVPCDRCIHFEWLTRSRPLIGAL